MLVPYTCCPKTFENHYAEQIGNGLPHYQGMAFQKGYGIGGFFAKLFRSAMPFLVRGAKTVGKEALRTGTLIANDVLSGETTFKESAKTRAKAAGKTLAKKALKKASDMIGNGRFKRKRKASRKVISPKAKKVKGRDIFDP